MKALDRGNTEMKRSQDHCVKLKSGSRQGLGKGSWPRVKEGADLLGWEDTRAPFKNNSFLCNTGQNTLSHRHSLLCTQDLRVTVGLLFRSQKHLFSLWCVSYVVILQRLSWSCSRVWQTTDSNVANIASKLCLFNKLSPCTMWEKIFWIVWSSGLNLLSSAILVSSQDLLSSIFLNEEMKGTVH